MPLLTGVSVDSNWLGNEQWLLQLEWEGQPDFKKQTLAPWHVPEESGRAGMFRSHDILTFATVARSGHFVPYDRPRQALGMYVGLYFLSALEPRLIVGAGSMRGFMEVPALLETFCRSRRATMMKPIRVQNDT